MHRISLDHAVFDLHFSPRDPSIFAVALSTAEVALYRIGTTNTSTGPRIQYLNTISIHEDPSQLSLFLAWIPPNLESSSEATPDGFAVSFSGGQISVFHANDPNTPAAQLTRENMTEIEFPGSPIEIWYVAFNSTKPSGHRLPSLFSGDDFSQLREFLFPGRAKTGDADEDDDEDSLAPYQNFNDKGRNHNAGVTAILPLFSDEIRTVLVTGSYDGNIRLYQLATRGQVLTEFDLGGGVWRLKLIKSMTRPDYAKGRDYYILASCMHAGARVVKLSYIPSGTGDEEWSFEVLVEFTEHESMNYASDFWLRDDLGAGGVDLLCVSSSFYDKRVCVWNVES